MEVFIYVFASLWPHACMHKHAILFCVKVNATSEKVNQTKQWHLIQHRSPAPLASLTFLLPVMWYPYTPPTSPLRSINNRVSFAAVSLRRGKWVCTLCDDLNSHFPTCSSTCKTILGMQRPKTLKITSTGYWMNIMFCQYRSIVLLLGCSLYIPLRFHEGKCS